jgi:hypothetical protein
MGRHQILLNMMNLIRLFEIQNGMEPFRGCELSINKVQWLDLTSQLWSTLKGFPFAKMVYSFHSHHAIFEVVV